MQTSSLLLLPVLLVLLLAAGCTGTPDPATETTSPYAGEETRTIKALSESDIEAYLNADGMGLAKAAELNRYPGPKHVLALADELNLTDDQRARTTRIYEEMRDDAVALGRRIVDQEGALDALFAGGEADAGDVRSLVRDLGALQADLRFAHLNAHLAMKTVLSGEQVAHYDQLRGYDASAPPGQHSEEMQHDHAH